MIIDIENIDKENNLLIFENGKSQKLSKGIIDFLEIEKGGYYLVNSEGLVNNIAAYYGKDPNLEKILYSIEQYQLLGEKWRDGHGHARIRKKKRKEIKRMLEDFEREYKEKFNKEEIENVKTKNC